MVVGVEGSEHSAGALALADLLAGPLAEARLLLVHTHPYRALSGFLGEGEYERLVREVADSTFFQAKNQVGERCLTARRPQRGLSRHPLSTPGGFPHDGGR